MIKRAIFQTFWKQDGCTIFLFLEFKVFKFWLLTYFFIFFNCAKFRQDWTTLVLDIFGRLQNQETSKGGPLQRGFEK